MLIELVAITLVVASATAPAAGAGLSIVQLVFTALAPSGIATLLTALYMRRKIRAETGHTDADAVQILTNTSVSLLEPMKQQIAFLSEQLSIANAKITELNERLARYEDDHPDP